MYTYIHQHLPGALLQCLKLLGRELLERRGAIVHRALADRRARRGATGSARR